MTFGPQMIDIQSKHSLATSFLKVSISGSVTGQETSENLFSIVSDGADHCLKGKELDSHSSVHAHEMLFY